MKQILLSSLPNLPLPVSTITNEGIPQLEIEVENIAQQLKVYLQTISNSNSVENNLN